LAERDPRIVYIWQQENIGQANNFRFVLKRATTGAHREGDQLNPLTAYARSKIATEDWLKQMGLAGMAVTCLRFATGLRH